MRALTVMCCEEFKGQIIPSFPCGPSPRVFMKLMALTFIISLRDHDKHSQFHAYFWGACDHNNGIATHAWSSDHRVNWEEARDSVIPSEPYYWKRRILEAIEIRCRKNTSNLDCGLALDPLYGALAVLDPITYHLYFTLTLHHHNI